MPRPNEFVPLNGPEVIDSVLADIRSALEARHDLFPSHLVYPRVSWQFQVDFDFYHAQDSVETSGVISGADVPLADAPERKTVSKRRRVQAPDQIREELLGQEPRIQEDQGESADALSAPQNDGIIRISRP